MKILVLNSILYTADNYLIPKRSSIKGCIAYSLCLAFQKQGHDATLIAATDYKPTQPEKHPFHIIFLNTHLKKVFIPSVLPLQLSLFSFLLKNKKNYDFIISSEVFSIPSLFSVLISKNKTIIWQELNKHNKRFNKIPSILWYNVLGRSLFRRVPIASRSESARRFIGKYCSNTYDKIIDHGVNLDNFFVSERKKKQFIVIAQLIKRKRVDYIITQFTRFIREGQGMYNSYKLKIAGTGPEELSLKRKAADLGINTYVEFLGFLSHKQLNIELSESIASLIATEKDLNMVSIPEAIVSGVPILTNETPALASYIKVNNLGIVKNNWTKEELRQMVNRHSEFALNCLNKRYELSSQNSAQHFINIYQSFISNENSSRK